jgi:heptosyltransferase II
MNIPAKPWNGNSSPKKVLAIRLQATGDVIITLPYLQQLRNSLPNGCQFDFLTREETESIPKSIHLFDKVYSIGGGRSSKRQLFYTILLLPKLFLQHYDVIIDLQNNIISRIVRKSLFPKTWSAFDRFSPKAAGERTRLTIEAVGLGKNSALTHFNLRNDLGTEKLLKDNGFQTGNELVVLNPAGGFETRNWPKENYLQFAKLYQQRFPKTQFVIMGIDLIKQKADFLKEHLSSHLINLVNKTTPAQAFAVIQKVKFVLSEDSGLMHMAWTSGIPTLAMFGSTRSDWSRPLGNHTSFLDSSDLECGNCMLEHCKYGDTHCLTRYSSEMIFEKSVALLENK